MLSRTTARQQRGREETVRVKPLAGTQSVMALSCFAGVAFVLLACRTACKRCNWYRAIGLVGFGGRGFEVDAESGSPRRTAPEKDEK